MKSFDFAINLISKILQTAVGSLPLLWSAVLFCATVPVLVALRRWFRVFIMAQRLPTPKAHPILGHAADFASKESTCHIIFSSHFSNFRHIFRIF
jgi:hypothetical protein